MPHLGQADVSCVCLSTASSLNLYHTNLAQIYQITETTHSTAATPIFCDVLRSAYKPHQAPQYGWDSPPTPLNPLSPPWPPSVHPPGACRRGAKGQTLGQRDDRSHCRLSNTVPDGIDSILFMRSVGGVREVTGKWLKHDRMAAACMRVLK